MRDCHREVGAWLEATGAKVKIDVVGNIRGTYPASNSGSARLLLGSHLDTVPNAGAYDGILGVVLAIALLEVLDGKKLPFALEIVGFSEEEGVRFRTPFIGSRALVGRIDPDLLARTDASGISISRAIQNYGLDPDRISEAVLSEDVLGYLEFHIEQGPVLEQLGRPLAVVDAIVGQSRLELTFVGHANHAGTTPMELRHDALAGAAEFISRVEQVARSVPGLVATVGSVDAKPGATNVIAGIVTLTLDVRHSADGVRTGSVEGLIQDAEAIARRRGLSVTAETKLNQGTVPMDPFLTEQIERAMQSCGVTPHRMASGAGHDAMILAEKVPSALIFLRTPGGISHDPAESVSVEDVAKAIECGVRLLQQLATSPQFQTRTTSA